MIKVTIERDGWYDYKENAFNLSDIMHLYDEDDEDYEDDEEEEEDDEEE